MTLDAKGAIDAAIMVLEFRTAEIARLNKIHSYLRDEQPHPATPVGAPNDLVKLARLSRVNISDIVVSSVAQAMYVDGYRAEREEDDAKPWEIWQANGMDARQIGVHRSTLTYGTSYVTVLPGDPMPVIRGYSPRRMTAIYDVDDDEWPMFAVRLDPIAGKWRVRLYDATDVYTLETTSRLDFGLTFISSASHSVGHVPVVRFLNSMDQDEDNIGEVEPLFTLQDQVNLTTFELLVAQHYGAFRQRYAIGWVAESEAELLKANASRVWTFEDSPQDVQVGEFGQTDLKGYLDSRESSLRHAATLSQTPVHELIGQMVNLSAEALVAAETGHRRKVTERQVTMGESWEAVLALAGDIAGFEVQDGAQVRWRDTESRALAATVDALGKMVTMLGVPPEELWERLPNVSQQDIARWKEAAKSGNALNNLTSLLDSQAAQLNPANTTGQAGAA